MEEPRVITQKEKQELLDMPSDNITNTQIVELFNHWYDRETRKHHEPKFHTYDWMDLKSGDLSNVHGNIRTTVGRFLLNKYMIHGVGLGKYIPYINEEINSPGLEKIGDRVADLFLNDQVDVPTVNRFLTVRDSFLSMIYQNILPSLTENMMRVQPQIVKMADELCERYKTEIEAGDLVTMNKIQAQLVKYAQELLQDDAAMILYQSGSKPVFSNNYKVLSIMRGPIKNEITGKYEFVTSRLVDGMQKENIPTSANTILASEYPTAIATASSGYQSKRIISVMQAEHVGEKGSDCGSKATLNIPATKKLANEYRYFIEGGKIKQLNPSNISKYEGKVLHFRSPMGCTRKDGPCNICAGDYPYLMGIRNIGIQASKISGQILNAFTKTKHDISYKTSQFVIKD